MPRRSSVVTAVANVPASARSWSKIATCVRQGAGPFSRSVRAAAIAPSTPEPAAARTSSSDRPTRAARPPSMRKVLTSALHIVRRPSHTHPRVRAVWPAMCTAATRRPSACGAAFPSNCRSTASRQWASIPSVNCLRTARRRRLSWFHRSAHVPWVPVATG